MTSARVISNFRKYFENHGQLDLFLSIIKMLLKFVSFEIAFLPDSPSTAYIQLKKAKENKSGSLTLGKFHLETNKSSHLSYDMCNRRSCIAQSTSSFWIISSRSILPDYIFHSSCQFNVFNTQTLIETRNDELNPIDDWKVTTRIL